MHIVNMNSEFDNIQQYWNPKVVGEVKDYHKSAV